MQILCKELGPLDGLILQVVAWHHYLSSISEVKSDIHSFESALKMWENSKNKNVNGKKLTISLVSELTAIPFETTRRKIKKLVNKQWITYSKEKGILYNSESELNEKIVKIIHPAEKNLLKEFLVAFLMSGKNS